MTKMVYYLAYALSLLPLRLLYALADVAYVFTYYVYPYRRKLVRNNLVTSFPEKTIDEIVKIEKGFYRWFCDYAFETVKLLSISEQELRRRFTITNSHEVEACFQEGRSVAAILGHYANWEWLSCVGIDLPPERKIGLIYHPLRNEAIDELFKKIRSSAGGVPIAKQHILRYLLQYKKEGIMSLFGYISDQAPKWENIHLWLPFLHHETPVFTGGERIMRKMNNAVFYVEMTRPRRGYYTCTYHLITREPNTLDEHEITRRFFMMLEKTIQNEPRYYLWSHNRWGRTKEEFDQRFEVAHGKVIAKEGRRD